MTTSVCKPSQLASLLTTFTLRLKTPIIQESHIDQNTITEQFKHQRAQFSNIFLNSNTSSEMFIRQVAAARYSC